ncbi:MAG: radical SAM protein [Candidatus Zixiibacteriota bacterium]
MRIMGQSGHGEPAIVYMAEMRPECYIEFVESVQPPYPRNEKWVLIVSTLYGCPVRCRMCDAGGWYKGALSADDIFAQIDFLVKSRYPDKNIPASKFKIQFARMGEPSLNGKVLSVLEELPSRYNAPGLMPCLSTVAPFGTDMFFERLTDIKNRRYRDGKFQMQFSIHSTCEMTRDMIIPIKKWNLDKIAKYGTAFYHTGDRKVALNFALAENYPVSADVIAEKFDPKIFMAKFTPVNPTINAEINGIVNLVNDNNRRKIDNLLNELNKFGFEVILSIGELEENRIGSNCGQYIRRYINTGTRPDAGYDSDCQRILPATESRNQTDYIATRT